jgi:1-aminocyclopropane-1-carboxylate deaminase
MTKSPISENQFLDFGNWKDKQVEVWVKREDLLDPFVSGNKFRKLKYNIQEAKRLEHRTILTFGGAFSNHIAATSAAAYNAGLESIGIIRGEELA